MLDDPALPRESRRGGALDFNRKGSDILSDGPREGIMRGGRHPRHDENAEVKKFIYNGLVASIIGDGELIWLRYNAMLAANTIVVLVLSAVAVKSDFGSRDAWVLMLTSSFGFALSWQWRGLTKRGWELQRVWVYEAAKRRWAGYKNAYQAYVDWRESTGRARKPTDWIEHYARRVIWLFLLAYLACFLSSGWVLLGIGNPWQVLERWLALVTRSAGPF